MGLILVTGASTGLGLGTVRALVDGGHDVVLHARRVDRVEDPQLLDRVSAIVTADLADRQATIAIADEINGLGRLDAVIHNAGVMGGPDVLAVNVLAPYILSVTLDRPRRSIFLSSSMHSSGSADLGGAGFSAAGRESYADSKFYVTTLAMALARLAPMAMVRAVDPGWVPTRMGGAGAPDDLEQGHQTQEWLATAAEGSISPRTGGYWYHRSTRQPHRLTLDPAFQDELISRLAAATGLTLT